jgi:hypothetical protein
MREFLMEVRNGRLRFLDESGYRAWLAEQPDGYVNVAFKSTSSGKTHAQLRYFYGVVIPSILQWMRDMGWGELGYQELLGTRIPIGVNVDNLDRYLKVLYAASRGIEGGVSKARMSKAEMTDYLEFVLAWAHENRIPIAAMEE